MNGKSGARLRYTPAGPGPRIREPQPRLGMSSEERQKVRAEFLEMVNKAEAEYFDARDRYETMRRDLTAVQNHRDVKARDLK